MPKKIARKAAISITVCGQDCSPETISANELDSIGTTFKEAAKAVRDNIHGTITLRSEYTNDELTGVDIDLGEGFPFTEEEGIPVSKVLYVGEEDKPVGSIDNNSVLQDWVVGLPLRMQSTLVLGLRRPDGIQAIGVGKICKWLRGLTFKPGNPDNCTEFMGEKPDRIPDKSSTYDELDKLPLHAFGHILHSLEVVAYKHPSHLIANHAHYLMCDVCAVLHLPVESLGNFEKRLKQIVWPGGKQPNDFNEAVQILKEHDYVKRTSTNSAIEE